MGHSLTGKIKKIKHFVCDVSVLWQWFPSDVPDPVNTASIFFHTAKQVKMIESTLCSSNRALIPEPGPADHVQ